MLREVKFSDAAALQKMNTDQLGYEVPVELTQKRLKKLLMDTEHHFFLIYEDEKTNEAIGYVHAEVYENIYFPTLFNVLSLAVDGKYQKQGIGKKLMSGLEEEALHRQYGGIRLNSGETRTEAYQFYERIGYKGNKLQKRFIKLL